MINTKSIEYRRGQGSESPAVTKSETGPRAQISQQVWCATGTWPALASVQFISAERTTESYQQQNANHFDLHRTILLASFQDAHVRVPSFRWCR